MRSLSFVLLFCVPGFAGGLDALGIRWTVPVLEDWKAETVDGMPTLQLLVPRPSTQPRRPSQYALAETDPYEVLDLELEVKQEPEAVRRRRNSLILVYAWRDAEHFNYAHLSVDTARQQPVHNGIFHVYGGDRVRISSEEGAATLAGEEWHKVRLHYDASQHRVEVWVNGKSSPSMVGVDLSLGAGRFGIGSFFDMGSFRRLKIGGRKGH